MQSTEVGQPFHRDGWVFEEKYDGWRMLAHKEAGHVRLISRNGRAMPSGSATSWPRSKGSSLYREQERGFYKP